MLRLAHCMMHVRLFSVKKYDHYPQMHSDKAQMSTNG
jgi:hypothetical protein